MEKLNGPVYRSWDEAMADPALDLSKPWFVAPEPVASDSAAEPPDWSGWTEIGVTSDL